jgi:hypothetical protein
MKGEKETVRGNFELEEIDIFTMNFDLSGEGTYIDEGIGAYEFWGAPGFDSQIVLSLEDIKFDIEIENVYDKEGEEVKIDSSHYKLIEKWIDDNPEKVDNKLLEL